jgi:hypothetical protein
MSMATGSIATLKPTSMRGKARHALTRGLPPMEFANSSKSADRRWVYGASFDA